MMMRLHQYITIVYKKGTEMLIADTLSRHHLDHTTDKAQGDEEVDSLGTINEILLCESTVTTLRDHTASDAELQLVQSFIQSGWPATSKDLDPTIVPYFHVRDELAIQDGIIFRGDRIVIPQQLRKQTLSDLHAAHQGIASTTRRARETVYWPHLNQELKDHIAGCPTCDQYHDKQPKQPLIPHEVLNRAWAKVGCDIFEFKNKSYVVTVDYYSNFFEVDRLDSLRSQALIKKLKPHFARYGIPDILVTDNGPQFTSEKFQKFSATYQLEHTTSTPYHHQSNGKAESAVKQAKRLLRTCDTSGNDVYLALLAVRSTPQTTHNTSTAQRMLNRRTKTPLPIGEQLLQPTINPHADERIRERQARQRKYYDRGARHLSPLKDGEAVRLQPTQIGTKIWKKGKVLRKVGIRSYEVQCNGNIYTRNRKFLKRSTAESESEYDADNDEPSDKSETEDVAVPTDNAASDGQESGGNEDVEASHQNRTRRGRVVRKPNRFGYSCK